MSRLTGSHICTEPPRWLRAGFDDDAEAYQRTRPVCPPEAFHGLVRAGGLGPGSRVLEIGCGTGQATVPMAERGLAVTAVELGASLADLARRRLAAFPSCQVITSSFEDWQSAAGERFDAVVAFNSLHWVEPSLRYAKPHELLKDSGAMVVGGCRWAQPADKDRFWTDVQEDYRAVGFEGEPPPLPRTSAPGISRPRRRTTSTRWRACATRFS